VVEKGKQMTQVIVDVGTNWDPSHAEDSWRELIIAAKASGADHIKGQDWHPIELMRRPDEWKERCRPWTLTPKLIAWIAGVAAECGIGFFCSSFTRPAIRHAYRFWYPFVKIASSEAANDDLLREIGSDLPVMISFGEGENWWRDLLSVATINAHAPVIPMACVADYPTSRVRAFSELSRLGWFKNLVPETGWSSHVSYKEGAADLAVRAVVRGAQYVEVHMRLKNTPHESPDNGSWALYPHEVAELVTAVKGVGDGQDSA
jgi:sialic acid synthase SpsE